MLVSKTLPNLLLNLLQPFLQGYCAPVKSPEPTCLKRFSNEETVPQPCLRSLVARSFFEHNVLVRSFGKIGFDICDKYRAPIFLSAFMTSTLGFVLNIAAACALSHNTNDVLNTYWAKGSVDDRSAIYYVGLSRYVTDNGADGDAESFFDWQTGASCNNSLSFESQKYDSPVTVLSSIVTSCETCRDSVLTIQRLVVISCVTQVFQITTDLQRTTR